jgi:hypothetical protein
MGLTIIKRKVLDAMLYSLFDFMSRREALKNYFNSLLMTKLGRAEEGTKEEMPKDRIFSTYLLHI